MWGRLRGWNSFAILIAALALLAPITHAARAEIIIDHTGNLNPATEGWNSFLFTPIGSNAGAITNDNGNDAWQIGKTDPFASGGYQYALTSDDLENGPAHLLPWAVTVDLRVVNTNDTPDYAVSVLFSVGTKRFDMVFGDQADGDPIVSLVSSFANDGQHPFAAQSYTLENAGPGYHTYKLLYNPTTTNADLYVDGILRIQGFQGNSSLAVAPSVIFGAFGTDGTGAGNYSTVRLENIPEPSTFSILSLLALYSLKRRKRKTISHI